MRFLLWLERHFAWVRFEGHHQDVEEAVIPRVFAHVARVDPREEPSGPKTLRTVLLNLGTSVGGAILIGIFSGIATANRVTQRTTDTLNSHEARLVTIEGNYVSASVHRDRNETVQAQFESLNLRETETRAQILALQSEINQLLLQQRAATR